MRGRARESPFPLPSTLRSFRIERKIHDSPQRTCPYKSIQPSTNPRPTSPIPTQSPGRGSLFSRLSPWLLSSMIERTHAHEASQILNIAQKAQNKPVQSDLGLSLVILTGRKTPYMFPQAFFGVLQRCLGSTLTRTHPTLKSRSEKGLRLLKKTYPFQSAPEECS